MFSRSTCQILKVQSNFYKNNQRASFKKQFVYFHNKIFNSNHFNKNVNNYVYTNKPSALFPKTTTTRQFREKHTQARADQPTRTGTGAKSVTGAAAAATATATATATAGKLSGVTEGRFTKVWNALFGKYLFATNVISSGILMVVGDVIAQFIEQRGVGTEPSLDYPRVWRMFLVGAAQGPLHHWVYAWMDRIMPTPTVKNVMKKILIDQILMSPVCILLFYYTACYLENKCLKETHAEIIDKFPLIYAFDWLLWPGAQYINFRYLDTKYRVFFVNVCTALYNIFISYIKHENQIPHLGTTISPASNPTTSTAKNYREDKMQSSMKSNNANDTPATR